MTLTLDEVRKTKFHMARRTGYEVSEVDLFVDRVEASFAQLAEENQALKQQVEALKQSQTRQSEQNQSVDPGAESARLSGQPEQPEKKATQAQDAKAAAPATDTTQKLVVSTSAEASPAVIRLVQLATDQSEQLVNEAADDAKRKIDEATRKAEQITNDANTKADRTTSEARSRAEDLDRQTGLRRTELFASLEQERDQLQEAVSKLRGFEVSYRQNFVNHLKDQLQAVQAATVEPGDKPELADRSGDGGEARRSRTGGGQGTSTPRLDALLNDRSAKG